MSEKQEILLIEPKVKAELDDLCKRAENNGWNEAICVAREAQPSTAADPNESAYAKGYFDGVMAYGAILRGLHRR